MTELLDGWLLLLCCWCCSVFAVLKHSVYLFVWLIVFLQLLLMILNLLVKQAVKVVVIIINVVAIVVIVYKTHTLKRSMAVLDQQYIFVYKPIIVFVVVVGFRISFIFGSCLFTWIKMWVIANSCEWVSVWIRCLQKQNITHSFMREYLQLNENRKFWKNIKFVLQITYIQSFYTLCQLFKETKINSFLELIRHFTV